LPDSVFFEYCPELTTYSKTKSGTPVFLQILGGNPEMMAANAHKAIDLGACGIDINFGCPARKVNNHDGGAALLRYPLRIEKIVAAVRKAVPQEIPVTAKIRLGYDNPNACIENSMAAEAGGADALTVHCRTKTDMYNPPAFWEWIPKIKEKTKIKIIANGEIWNVEDFNRCREITGCDEVMIGRGALANPYLFSQIKNEAQQDHSQWRNVRVLLPKFFDTNERIYTPHFAKVRTKQWLSMISKQNGEAKVLFDRIKVITEPALFREQLLN
jgi:tRNA-dihydrouridine synthase C